MAFLDILPRRYGSAEIFLYSKGGKRLFDLILCLCLIPFVVPVIAVLWFISSANGNHGFYAHPRVGRYGKTFKCWKIRTMEPGADHLLNNILEVNADFAYEWRHNQKLKNDPRVLRFGRFLRVTSMDELPQIWNVLRGDMSFVGPRPITRVELVRYDDAADDYLSQRPGITGLWQVSGRGEVSFKQRVRLDQEYIHHISLVEDLVLLFRTIAAVLRATGQ